MAGTVLHLDFDMDLCREMLVDEMHLGCALSMMETLLDRDNDQCPQGVSRCRDVVIATRLIIVWKVSLSFLTH